MKSNKQQAINERTTTRVLTISLQVLGVYWSGGLGVWEFVFGSLMLFIAFKGLKHYYFIGIGWLLHTVWDNTVPPIRKSNCVS